MIPPQQNKNGSVLVIALLFTALILGLLIAFLSNSTLQQMASKASSTQALNGFLGQAAIDTVISDLRQEIVDGSFATNVNVTNGVVVSNTLYIPVTNNNAVPQLVGCATNMGAQLPNLIKISTNLPFYSLTNSHGVLIHGTVRATTNSSANPSYTGLSVSPAQWNQPLLLPVTSAADYTPPAATGFVPPAWILIARNGANPTNWSVGMRWTTAGAGAVIGRYAYAIYNEGGLLDANVAGYPEALTNYASGIPTNLAPSYKEGAYFADLHQIGLLDSQIAALVGWRNFVTAGASGSYPGYNVTTSGAIDYAESVLANSNGFLSVATATGSTSNSVMDLVSTNPLSPATDYSTYSWLTNPTNLTLLTDPARMTNLSAQMLATASMGSTNQGAAVTDRQFVGRQQLISFLLNADPANQLAALTALQSLGSFSRSLVQPSYRPDPNRPRIVSATAPDYAANGGNNAAGLDDQINPSFLSLRVTNSFLRTNAYTVTTPSAAIVGEPLIKQRFALNRLAWITYKGPSATLFTSGTNTTDPEMLYYMSNGISASLLTNGTAANIMSYFGLTWSNNPTSVTGGAWYYNVHNGSVTGVNNQGSINRLSAVAALPAGQGREPDFFELLKATQDVGSIAKGSIAGATAAGTGVGSGYIPLNWQYKLDTSVDYAVIQLGANIIDQFDPDSFPTRIRFDDGSLAPNVFLKEFRGVEDLPYIYRIRYGNWIGRNSQNSSGFGGFNSTNYTTLPPETNDYRHAYVQGTVYSGGSVGNFLSTLTDAGVGVLLALPDVWNPHSPSATSVPATLQPTQLRVTAMSETPDDILNGTTGSQGAIHVGSFTDSSTFLAGGAYPPNFLPGTNETAVTNGVAWSSYSYSAKTLTATPAGPPFANGYSNNLIITTNTSSVQFPYATNLFREPTLLAEYGKPTVGLVGTTMVAANPDLTGITAVTTGLNNSGGTKLLSGGSLHNSATQSIPGNSLGKPSGDSGQYVGIFVGLYPLRWVDNRASGFPTKITYQVYSAYLLNVGNTGIVPTPALTYLLQYQDPNNTNNWITYDEKYADVSVNWNLGVGMLQSPERPSALTYVDPRTSRFGAPELSGGGEYFGSTVVPQIMNTNAWLDSANNVLWSDRPDYGIGTAYVLRSGSPSVASGWATFAAPGWHASGLGTPKAAPYYQPSLLSQNNPYFQNSGVFFTNIGGPSISNQDPVFYGDPDGVVRRAMGGYYTNSTVGNNPMAPALGLPLATANSISGGVATPLPSGQGASRPIMLNRPFHSVAEMGAVFSGTPWRNIDFFTPESGDSALLDVFCINPPPADTMIAGAVDLNTRNTNVLAAILAGGYRDTMNPVDQTVAISGTEAANAAGALIGFTATNPLGNVADLVGRWKGSNAISGTFTPALTNGTFIDGAASYVGVSGLFTNTVNSTNNQIQRYREAPIRALSAAGQTRVWNLLIDLVVQSGKYPPTATGVDGFWVQQQQRYWVHVAIDRQTGRVIDQQTEVISQ